MLGLFHGKMTARPRDCATAYGNPTVGPGKFAGISATNPLVIFIATITRMCRLGYLRRLPPLESFDVDRDCGGQDVFVHISAVEKAGRSTLNEGQQVEFEIVSNRGKSSAENLKVK